MESPISLATQKETILLETVTAESYGEPSIICLWILSWGLTHQSKVVLSFKISFFGK